MPKCRVVDPAFTWGDDRPPRVPWHETVIYELHVRGLHDAASRRPASAARHLRRPRRRRRSIEHLRAARRHRRRADAGPPFRRRPPPGREGARPTTGATTRSASSRPSRATRRDRPRRASSRRWCKTLHAAGHRGDPRRRLQPHRRGQPPRADAVASAASTTPSYYRLQPDNPRYYIDFTGCGNTLNMRHPRVLQLIMDSLRYWVLEMHVDGFRFDLASALARELHEVDRLGAFFDIIHQDPVLSRVKLIAEPWDLGEGGYQVGNFPAGWAEWNDRYRDTMRAFWKGDGGLIGEFAQRLTGSSDLYGHSGRRPHASINFVTAHDGFTLHDLVSYNDKHNEANGEDNRDGHDDNLSWNCGVEGDDRRPGDPRAARAPEAQPAGDAAAVAGRADAARRRRDRAHPARQQQRVLPGQRDLAGSTGSSTRRGPRSRASSRARVIGLLKAHPVFRRRRFFQGRPIRGSDGEGPAVAHAGRTRDERRRVVARPRPLPRRLPVGQRDHRDRRARAAAARRQLPAAGQRPPRRRSRSCCRRRAARRGGSPCSTRSCRTRSPRPDVRRAGAVSAAGPLAGAARASRPRCPPRERTPRAVKRRHAMPFGAELRADGATRFRLWAPAARRVDLALTAAAGRADLPMTPRTRRLARAGRARTRAPAAATRFASTTASWCPIPRRAAIPTTSTARAWSSTRRPSTGRTATGAAGRWEEAVIYELHVGTFTPEGTFAGVESRLDHLAELGVTAIELMPVAEFPGRAQLGLRRRAAVRARRGVRRARRPEAAGPGRARARAHGAARRRLQPLRPAGQLSLPPTRRASSPDATDAVGRRHRLRRRRRRPVRDFFIHNALYWIEEFHVDGLRLDAVHAIFDDVAARHPRGARDGGARGSRARSATSTWCWRTTATRRAASARRAPRATTRSGTTTCTTRSTCSSTGERDGYYARLRRRRRSRSWGAASPRASPTRATPRRTRGGAPRGEPSAHLPPSCFVPFLQNHDQIGNRAFGDRLASLAPPQALRAAVDDPAARAAAAAAVHGRGVGRARRRSRSSATSPACWPRR